MGVGASPVLEDVASVLAQRAGDGGSFELPRLHRLLHRVEGREEEDRVACE